MVAAKIMMMIVYLDMIAHMMRSIKSLLETVIIIDVRREARFLHVIMIVYGMYSQASL